VRKVPPFHLFYCKSEKIIEMSDGAWYCGNCGGDALGYQYGEPPKWMFPKYNRGDLLYVRETWAQIKANNGFVFTYYKANEQDEVKKWRPSIHMPKEAARLFLCVTDVRAERLQDISAADIENEGLYDAELAILGELKYIRPGLSVDDANAFTERHNADSAHEYRLRFAVLWDKLYGKSVYSWEVNPYVWAYTFERVIPQEVTQ
jgi:hypothetical protein